MAYMTLSTSSFGDQATHYFAPPGHVELRGMQDRGIELSLAQIKELALFGGLK